MGSRFIVFVPSLGDFFSMDLYYCGYCDAQYMFSSPLPGTFFNNVNVEGYVAKINNLFSSPLSGTFFQFCESRHENPIANMFSSPFSGTFFQ